MNGVLSLAYIYFTMIKYNKRGIRTGYIATIVGIALVLFIISILIGGTMAIDYIQKQAKESFQADVFFQADVSDEDIKAIEMEVRNWDEVHAVRFVNSEQAINEIAGLDVKGQEILEILDGAIVIPSNVTFSPKAEYANVDGMAMITSKIKNQFKEEVDTVDYNVASLEKVNLGFKKFVYLFGIIALILVVVALSLINNTIRLALYAERFNIKTMQLVGASNQFIRSPYLKKALANGVLSAIIGFALFLAVIQIIEANYNFIDIYLSYKIMGLLLATLVIIGITISYFATWFALNKYLRTQLNDLY